LKGVNENGVFPNFVIEGQDPYSFPGVGYDAQNNFDINDSLSWIKGRHTIKFGLEYLKMQSNDAGTGGDAGSFNFGTPETGIPGPPEGYTGAGMASFLLGLVDSGQANVYTSGNAERSGYWAGYVQDNFKVTPKLTFNYGLRYDLYRPTVDAHNHLAWMDPAAPNPAIGGFPGTMVFATPQRRTGVDQFMKGFAPRLGFAYRLGDKTVVRASYGIFWAAGGYVRASRGLYIQGYNAFNALNSPDGGLTPAFVFQDGWPADRFPEPPYINPAFGFNSGVHILDREDARPPYLQNWTLNI
jgi:outer membrane receptor protein involved in Fe transport